VTTDAAVAMAEGVRRMLGADIGIAATGVAGPDEQEGRPVGTVCLAVISSTGEDAEPVVESLEIHLPGGRRQIREFTVITLLGLLRRHLLS